MSGSSQALEQLDPSKKPAEAAFLKLLDQIDVDADGKISVIEWTGKMNEMLAKMNR